LTELTHCYQQSGVQIAYRTIDSLGDLATHRYENVIVLSSNSTPEQLLRIILGRLNSGVSCHTSTMFYVQGEPDAERVESWLHSIDQGYPTDLEGTIFLGTSVHETAVGKVFEFKRLKARALNDSWIHLLGGGK
jgi:hypothetical protein